MIRNVAIEILNLIEDNNGYDINKITRPNMDIQKIIDIILSECRCSIIDKNGNYARFGSSTDIRVIKILIQIFLSNSKEIPPEVVSMALTKEGVIGPFRKIGLQKQYIKEEQFCEIEMEEVFPNEFNVNIFEKNLEIKEEFINEIIKPYVKTIIYENDILMNKSPLTSYISKIFSHKYSEEEYVNELIQILNKTLTCNEELTKNIANYIFVNIMNNKFFKTELVSRTLDATELQKLGKIYTGFGSLVESMSYEALQMIEMRSFPYGELISIKDTFYAVITVLTALSTNLEGMSEEEILHEIEQTNRNYNITNKSKSNKKIKYRTKKITSNKYGISAEFVNEKDISKSMQNICKMIKVLLDKKDEVSTETYIKEVFRIHYRFVRIQPFESANGRTARAIVNMLLQSKGMIGIFRKEKRKEYIEAISEADKVIKKNEKMYVECLVENPIECIELENEFLDKGLPFLVVKN